LFVRIECILLIAIAAIPVACMLFCFTFIMSSAVCFDLAFVDAAVGDVRDLLRSATLSPDVGHLVQCFDAGHNVAKDPGELGVHIGQNDAELRCNLEFHEKNCNISF
jgi:hypothetical protein